jgi:histidine triad (HIT) family protein
VKYDEGNIFAKIIRGEVKSTKIYEDEYLLAFEDINKSAPVHVIIIPKGQFVSFCDFTSHASETQISYFFKTISKIAKKLDIVDSGFRLVTNNGADASQSVPHFHFHMLGKKKMEEKLL